MQDTLKGEVDTLRTENEELKSKMDAMQEEASVSDWSFVEGLKCWHVL